LKYKHGLIVAMSPSSGIKPRFFELNSFTGITESKLKVVELEGGLKI
jgi:hypothetical protein